MGIVYPRCCFSLWKRKRHQKSVAGAHKSIVKCSYGKSSAKPPGITLILRVSLIVSSPSLSRLNPASTINDPIPRTTICDSHNHNLPLDVHYHIKRYQSRGLFPEMTTLKRKAEQELTRNSLEVVPVAEVMRTASLYAGASGNELMASLVPITYDEEPARSLFWGPQLVL